MNSRFFVERLQLHQLPRHFHSMAQRRGVWRAWYRVGPGWWRPVSFESGDIQLFNHDRGAETAAFEAWQRHQQTRHEQPLLPFNPWEVMKGIRAWR